MILGPGLDYALDYAIYYIKRNKKRFTNSFSLDKQRYLSTIWRIKKKMFNKRVRCTIYINCTAMLIYANQCQLNNYYLKYCLYVNSLCMPKQRIINHCQSLSL